MIGEPAWIVRLRVTFAVLPEVTVNCGLNVPLSDGFPLNTPPLLMLKPVGSPVADQL